MFFGLWKDKPKEKEEASYAHSDPVAIEKASSGAPEYVKDYEDGNGAESVDTYYTAFSASDLVNSCVSYISDNGGLTKLKIGQKDSSGKMVPLKNKKVRELFDTAPNAFFTWQELLEQTIQSYLLTGNTYLSFEAIAKYELWLLESNKIKIVPDATDYVKGYIYNDKINFETNELLHIRRASSNNLYYGSSAVMQCLKDSLLLEGYATTDMKEFFENSSVGNGVLTSEFPLSSDQIDSVRAQFAENYNAGKKRHSTVILPSKMEYKNVRLSPKDAMLLEALDVSSDRVLRVFKMHKVILGGDIKSYSNKMDDIARLAFNTGIKPITEKIAGQLQLFFRKLLKTENLFITCDYDNISYMSDAIEKADDLTKLTASGVISYNEARDLLGMSLIDNPNYDKRWLPAHLLSGNPVSIDDFQPGMDLGSNATAPTTVDPQGGSNSTAGAN